MQAAAEAVEMELLEVLEALVVVVKEEPITVEHPQSSPEMEIQILVVAGEEQKRPGKMIVQPMREATAAPASSC